MHPNEQVKTMTLKPSRRLGDKRMQGGNSPTCNDLARKVLRLLEDLADAAVEHLSFTIYDTITHLCRESSEEIVHYDCSNNSWYCTIRIHIPSEIESCYIHCEHANAVSLIRAILCFMTIGMVGKEKDAFLILISRKQNRGRFFCEVHGQYVIINQREEICVTLISRKQNRGTIQTEEAYVILISAGQNSSGSFAKCIVNILVVTKRRNYVLF